MNTDHPSLHQILGAIVPSASRPCVVWSCSGQTGSYLMTETLPENLLTTSKNTLIWNGLCLKWISQLEEEEAPSKVSKWPVSSFCENMEDIVIKTSAPRIPSLNQGPRPIAFTSCPQVRAVSVDIWVRPLGQKPRVSLALKKSW